MISTRTFVFIVGAVLTASALGSCTSAHPSPPAPKSTESAETTVPATAVPTTTADAGPTTSASSVLQCTGSQIRVTGSGLANVPAPPDAVLLVFTNSSTATCSLTGYPGVATLAASGQQVAQATRTLAGRDGGCGCTKPSTVTLTPGKQASTIVEYDHYIKCQQPTALLVTPPNTTHSVKVPFVPDGQCGYVVHPVVPGDHGFIAK